METVFSVEWQGVYHTSLKRYCTIQTKEGVYRADQMKKTKDEPYKNAKKHKVIIVHKMASILAMHIVLSHNALVRQQSSSDGLSKVIEEHLRLKIESLENDVKFYLGINE